MSTTTAAPTPTPTPAFLSTARRGDVARWSQTIIPTAREAPADAKLPSHVLLIRGGYIRQVTAGVYTYLPLAWRVLQKVSQIVREEMNAAGASELLMPALAPMEHLKKTGRAEAYGDLLFRLTDRHDRESYLGPTHEEVITDLLMGMNISYKQLPLNLYQIQTKFRDEFRPRAGLLRGREFVMKDAYSFHTSVEGPGGLDETYDKMYRAYVNVFTRCGLDFTAVEAESGPIGGSASHEFMVNCENGEDTILVCPATGYAANVEKCETGPRPWSFDAAPTGELKTHHTPGMPGIEGVAQHLGTTPAGMLKTIVLEPAVGASVKTGDGGVRWVLAVVRGDHEVNEGKVRDAAGFPVKLADEKAARAAGFAIGYVSPRAAAAIPDTLLLIDPDATGGRAAWATGSDKPDHHDTNFSWTRDSGLALPAADAPAGRVRVADIRNALPGDPSPRDPSARLEARRGIEVGHIFQLGTKYSEAMGLHIMDAQQQRNPAIMGCYGIGVSRTMQACVEMSFDDDGIVWPAPVAPFHALIVMLDPDVDEHKRIAADLADQLSAAGADVLIDDRPERPGVKFKDADLIGIPVRITIGAKALANGNVELKHRRDKSKGEQVSLADAAPRALDLLRS